MYEIETDTYTFVDLPNPKPFLSFYINSIDCLVEGSEKQYDALFKNFGWKLNLKLLNTIVTPTGGEVEFFEGLKKK